MKYVLLTLILVFVTVPTSVFAICSDTGATVVFVNGIMNSQQDANDSKDGLQRTFQERFGKNPNITFITGYNPSHLAGAGDLAQSATQVLGGSISDYDLKTILMQIQPEVTTQKILLIGHSQGTLYTNSIYKYLVESGVPAESIAVYNVATPAHKVAGNGAYLTSSNDSLIRKLAEIAKKLHTPPPIPSNINIPIFGDDAESTYPGHNFIRAYLAGASDKIVSDVSRALDGLAAKTNTDSETCFNAPPSTMGYKIESTVFAVADPTAAVIGNAALAVAKGIGNTAAVIFAFVQSEPPAPPPSPSTLDIETTKTPSVSPASSVGGLVGGTNPNLDVGVPQPGGVTNLAVKPPSEAAHLAAKPPSDGSPSFLQLSSVGGGSPGFGGGSPAPSSSSVFLASPAGGPKGEGATTTSDATPPDIFLNVAECPGLSSDPEKCLLASATASVVWSSTAEDLNHFIVECEKVGPPAGGCDGFSAQGGPASGWNFASTTATSTVYILPFDGADYVFKAKAVDNAGNESAETTKTVVFSTRPVVINEVAWAGTKADGNDEWIELYNHTSSAISLDGWALYAEADSRPNILLAGEIKPYDYFLLERKDDDAVSDIAADLIYGNDGPDWALNNSGEALALARASTTIDRAVLCGNKWCGGYAGADRASMERIDPDIDGTDLANWGSANGIVKNGLDFAGNALTATPRARNSLHYLISRGPTLLADRTLKSFFKEYIIPQNETLVIPQGRTLTIEPGVAVKMGGSASLEVNGTLKADGTEANNIIFTRISDQQDYWKNIRLTADSQNSSVSYAKFQYGGRYFSNTPPEWRAAFSIINNSTPVSYSVFKNSFSAGARLTLSDSAVEHNTFSAGTTTFQTGLYVGGGAPAISQNTFSENYMGLELTGSAAAVENNIFLDNRDYAARSTSGSGGFSRNSGSGNGKNGIALVETISTPGGTTTFSANGLPYLIGRSPYDNPKIAAGSAVIVEADTVWKGEVNNARFEINGTMKLEGADKDSILFTSLADSGPAEWHGIVVNAGGYVYGGGFTLKYGGYGTGCSSCAGFSVTGGRVDLSDGRIENNYKVGMQIYNSATSSLSNFEFSDHQTPAGGSTALVSSNSTLILDNLTFSNNFANTSPEGLY
ncbi:hypothetical protein A3I36_02160 [Candidatus Giovannonibacteria bacterium RIFCSPLOWO2_02_FULL_45_28]|uniref:Polymorphic membrane protein n=3 Tax=Parcubacteria group TaxID=1794811 RepID=A0A837IG28_9BACT|nr:MAG: Polymorphic membrane protein [Candidatus Giovannonibacteria bacterium GW2011_GWA1_44_25]KKU12102.1 MAG: Polymorphic membrane protein [Candidatus Azambacteria bacterium GW2011_GWC2_45_7b]KKU28917.1 MAG: Polymorphic membrane protein [Candidatus Giovannonibacteria bacterium GW2011_GWB1_46_20]OGF50025.1 MAG: hypothetical protein A2120_02775 [Candidatus Giovannonibacteria bacterium GWA2_45_15]OGF59346.1 MAG: hypothetical protein A2W40_04160 [Candidatus Giovannonibacteria bacterium RIFCSPHIGH